MSRNTCDNFPRVLIVEDDSVARHGLALLLGLKGFHIATASTLAEGLVRLDWRAQFLVLDLSLSDGRGTVMLRRIRAERLPIRVAVTTGTADESLVAAAEILRPDRLFRKPYGTVDLLSWLHLAVHFPEYPEQRPAGPVTPYDLAP